MLCRDVMKGDVRFITAQTTVAQAAAIMRDELEGVISLSDIAQLGDGADATATLRSVTVREARA